VHNPKLFLIAAGAALWLPMAAQAVNDEGKSTNQSAQSTEEPGAVKCRKALVNPVTGHAICIDPKGAPVDPPPREALQRPCPPRKHDDDPWTTYEHWSGCHD